MHVLVVDPNVAFATLLTEELSRQGYDVTQCADGAEALNAARAYTPELALLDMALEEPDAIDLARQLREINPSLHLMLIPLIGEDLDPSTTAISVQGVLPKPFFLPELPERIEAALRAPVKTDSAPSARTEPAPVSSPEPEPEAVETVKIAAPPPIQETTHKGGISPQSFRRCRRDAIRAMEELAREVGADAVLLSVGDELITWTGQVTQTDAEAIAVAVLHGWNTAQEVARILGREQSHFEQSISGGDYMLYALSVKADALLSVAIRGTAPLGLLRHRTRGAAEEIAEMCI